MCLVIACVCGAGVAVFVFSGGTPAGRVWCGFAGGWMVCGCVGMLSGVWGDTFFPWCAVVVSCAVVVCGAVAVVLCENWIVDASILFFCVYLHDRIFVFL